MTITHVMKLQLILCLILGVLAGRIYVRNNEYKHQLQNMTYLATLSFKELGKIKTKDT